MCAGVKQHRCGGMHPVQAEAHMCKRGHACQERQHLTAQAGTEVPIGRLGNDDDVVFVVLEWAHLFSLRLVAVELEFAQVKPICVQISNSRKRVRQRQ